VRNNQQRYYEYWDVPNPAATLITYNYNKKRLHTAITNLICLHQRYRASPQLIEALFKLGDRVQAFIDNEKRYKRSLGIEEH